MLVAEINPVLEMLIVGTGIILGGAAGIGTGAAAVAGLKSVGIVVSSKAAKWIVGIVGGAGAIGGGAVAAPR